MREALVPVITRIDNIETKIDSIETRMGNIETRMGNIETRMDSIETRMDSIETRMDSIETRMDSMETRISSVEINLRVMDIKSRNATCTRDDKLYIVPLRDGSDPTCEYPESIGNLIVSDGELLPEKDVVNNWNKTKSLDLIKQYEPDYSSDPETSDNECSERSRNRRLKVAKLIGITGPQLNFAQLSLWMTMMI